MPLTPDARSPSTQEFWLNLGTALLCGGAIGLERQSRGKVAGVLIGVEEVENLLERRRGHRVTRELEGIDIEERGARVGSRGCPEPPLAVNTVSCRLHGAFTPFPLLLSS